MSDGTVIIDTDLDNSGLEKGWKKANESAKSQAAKLASEYKKQGMSASEAFKKAWSEIERDSKEKANKTASNWNVSTENIKVKLNSLLASGTKAMAGIIAGAGATLTGLGAIAIKEGIQFESAFTGVRKTVDATEEQFTQLENAIRNMAKNMPESASEIAGVAEAAGQLGIKTANIEGFTETMVMLGDATNLSSEEAATQLARLANITGMSQEDFDKLGSSIVACGNNFATTEAEITAMSLRLAGAGSQVGMSESEIVGLSAALSSVGIEAEAGGSAFSTLISKMQLAAEKGGESLNDFSKVAGMSSSEFKKAFKEDASGAILSFIDGLSKCEENGQSAIGVLDGMGITEIRMRDALLRASGASETFTNAIELSNNAWEENTALTKEAETRYATMESQLKMLKNAAIDLGIEFYKSINNPIADIVKSARGMVEELSIAFKEKGFEGLVNKLGDVFSQIAIGIAEYTPSIIKASVQVIKSFIKGLKDNSNSISSSAVSIVESLADGIVDILPDVIDIGAELAINLIDGLSEKLPALTPRLTKAMIEIVNSILDNSEEFISAGAELLSGLAKGLSNEVPGLGAILDPMASALNLISNNADLVVSSIVGIGTALIALKGIDTVQSLVSSFRRLSTIVSLTSFTPVLVAVAAIGSAVALYNKEQRALNNTFNVSEEEMGFLEKALLNLNGVETKNRKELEEMGAVYKEFGENIGSNFRNKVEDSANAIHQFNVKLSEINLDGILDDSETDEFNNRVEECINIALETIENKRSESKEKMNSLFLADDSVIDKNEQAIIELCTAEFETEAEEVRKNQDEINKIYNQARTEGRSLTEDEISAIKQYYANIKQIELQVQAENNDELEYAKIDFNNRAKNLDAQGASELLVQKKSQLNELIIQKENEYDQIILKAEEGAAKLSGADKEAAEEKIELLKQKKEDTIKNYQDEWNEYKNIIDTESPSIVGQYSNFTGELLSEQDKLAIKGMEKFQENFDNLNSITETGWYRIRNSTTGDMENIYATVDKGTGEITGAWSETTNVCGGLTDEFKDKVKELGEEHEADKLKVQNAMAAMSSSTVNANGEIINSNDAVVGSLMSVVTATGETVDNVMNLNGMPVQIEFNSDGVITSMHQIGESMSDVEIKTNTATKQVNSDLDAIPNQARTVKEKAVTELEKMPEGMSAVGQNVTAGIGNGIDSGQGSLFSKIQSLCSNLLTKAKAVLDIHSPSRKMRDLVGKFIPLGIEAGIDLTASQLLNTVSNLGFNIVNTLHSIISSVDYSYLTKNVAEQLVSGWKSASGTFSNLAQEIENAQNQLDFTKTLKAEEDADYSAVYNKLEDVKAKIDELKDQKSETDSKGAKKSIESQQKVLEKEKESLEQQLKLEKEVAQKEIDKRKETAQEAVNIAKEKSEKLKNIAAATVDALKAKLEEEKTTALDAINSEMDAEENRYNKKIESIDSATEKKKASLEAEIALLEDEVEEENRLKEIQEAKNNIAVLETKMANTASVADKKAYALKIKNAKAALEEKQKEWNIEDEKAKIQEQINNIEEKSNKKKEALKEEYEVTKESYEKQKDEVEEYYSKLLETDSLNAQARYLLLQNNSSELVNLLQSYNPLWQDVGQSLADSLLYGLNSQKQSIKDAVEDMLNITGGAIKSKESHMAVSSGYATGTSYNKKSGLYNVDEKGFELSTNNNPVAYVSKGAGILNHMQSVKAIDDRVTSVKNEIYDQVSNQMAALKSMVIGQQQQMYALASAMAGNTTNNTSSIKEGDVYFNVEHFHNDNSQSIESISSELGFLYKKNKRC